MKRILRPTPTFAHRLALKQLVLDHGPRVFILTKPQFAPLAAITEEHFDKTFDANVKGLLFTVQKALPLLKDGSSVILNASIVASTGPPAMSVYSASKAAVRSFARTFTRDLKDRKIRVNAISPGVIPSPG